MSLPAAAQEPPAGAPVAEREKRRGDILWSVTPYVWAVDTKLDVIAEGDRIGGAEVSFSDLVDTLDMAIQTVVEAGIDGTNWSALVDLTYLSTSDSTRIPTNGGDQAKLATDSEQYFIDAAIAYWPGGVGSNLSLFGGIRYTDLDDEFVVKDPDDGTRLDKIDNSRSYTDALLGGRYMHDLNNHWSVITRADYGFGDSEGVWLVQAMLRYAVGKNRQNGIMLGYRYKDGEFESGGIEEDYEYKGPIAAFNFRF
ncbi:MAG: hypothetical protein ACR2QG_00295 [Gammaproteobacteria bacterium]